VVKVEVKERKKRLKEDVKLVGEIQNGVDVKNRRNLSCDVPTTWRSQLKTTSSINLDV
jgi:hypothetical protein